MAENSRFRVSFRPNQRFHTPHVAILLSAL
jgi:hypothetical protein